MPSPRSEFISGIRSVLTILLGVIPFGLIYGVLALDAGIPPGAAQAMSVIVFAGSAQFIASQLVGTGTPAFVIVLTVAVVNLRHMLYSASITPYVQKLNSIWKWSLAYLLTDEAYAVTIIHYQENSGNSSEKKQIIDHKNWFFLGAGLGLWSTWQISTAAGIFIGTQVPESWPLDFTLALTFIALVVPTLKDRASAGAALAAGVIAIATFTWPYKLGLVTAAMVGILVGIWIEMER